MTSSADEAAVDGVVIGRKLATRPRKYDAQLKTGFDAIRTLMAPPAPVRIAGSGFHSAPPVLRGSRKERQAAV